MAGQPGFFDAEERLRALVPDGPGLGIALDRAALERWHRHFVENGPMDHFHDPARPGRFRRLPLA